MQYKWMLGYEKGPDGKPLINEEQAETVRFIYQRYLAGDTLRAIKSKLEAQGALNAIGKQEWTIKNLLSILSNEKYCGDALLQKTFIQDCISKKVIPNTGQLPKYLIQNHHEGIVSRETFDAVQLEMARRAAKELHLTPIGREYGLVDDTRWAAFTHDMEVKKAELHRLETTKVPLAELRTVAPPEVLETLGESGGTAAELLKRPGVHYELLAKVIGRGQDVSAAMALRIETEIRYAGYIAREQRAIHEVQRHENVVIPDDFDYAPLETVTLEAREKLAKIRPRTLAQAGRIPGVSPSDLAQLSIALMKAGKTAAAE